MKAFILAAGTGSRLLPLTRDTPKCLLDVCGTTLLEYQLIALERCGIEQTIVIGGFRIDLLRAHIEHCLSRHALTMTVEVIENLDYNSTNNLHSLWLAREEMQSDFVVVNADNLFELRVLREVLARGDRTAVLAIRRHHTYDADDMKVKLDGNQVTRIGKALMPEETHAESIGLRAFRGAGVRAFIEAMDGAVADDANRTQFFVVAIQRMIDAGHKVEALDVTPYRCVELDSPEDLKVIEREMTSWRAGSAGYRATPPQDFGPR